MELFEDGHEGLALIFVNREHLEALLVGLAEEVFLGGCVDAGDGAVMGDFKDVEDIEEGLSRFSAINEMRRRS